MDWVCAVLHRDDDLHGMIEGKRDTGLILALTLGSPEVFFSDLDHKKFRKEGRFR